MKNNLAAFILLLLVAVSSGGRTGRQDEECSVKCDATEDRLFKAGKAYSYLYEGESNIKTTLGGYDSTGLLVKSKIIVTALSNCEMKLTMTDVEISDKNSEVGDKFVQTPFSDKAKEVLEKNEVLFTRQNGEVQSVCVNKNEPIWSQNMKKSIIDILANQGENSRENRFFEEKKTRHGNCLVRKVTKEDRVMKMILYDVTSCKSSSGKSLFTDLSKAIVFKLSVVECKYGYTNKDELQGVHCTEDYDTNSLRGNGNNINVRVISRFESIGSKGLDMSYPKNDLIKSDIQMKPEFAEKRGEYYTKAMEPLKLMCEPHLLAKKFDIPKTFMSLVNNLKKLTASQVHEFYMEVLKTDVCPGQNNENIRSMFYDAIGFVNTPAATSVMVDLIKTKQISEIDQAVWFTSLSFMQASPSLDMIKDLETLLQTKEFNKQMYLGVSAVTHLYCKDDARCLMDPTVRNILSFFLKNVGQDCSASKTIEDISKTQISLKSLGNLKLFNEDVVTILSKCAATKSNPTEIRVSALEVMKHMDCAKDRSVAMEILQNNENDSEMRIHAYLTVMGCPDINNMFKVREILSKEKVNQVGSFIWTHLTNIQESDDILKSEIQNLLNDVELKNEFDISKLKFSRNIEKTFKMDKLQMTLDSNVIFSEKSFVPRSVSINTTAVVLNRPTNFIEMSARMEGLDDLLFKLLGPDGYLKKRSKQNTADDNVALVKLLEEVNGNLNLKLFGQQISFVELIRGSLSSVKKYNILEELMNLGQEKSIEFKKNLVLLDKVATIPTSLGFPLRFTIQGSVSVKLKIKSKIDITGLMKWPISLNIDNEIAPSIMSEFSSEIAIETPFSNYGMSVRMKSGTDTAFKALVSAGNNEEFTIKFDTPKKRQEIVTVSGKSFVIYREREIEQLVTKVQKYELCSPQIVNTTLDINLCGNVEFADAKTRDIALFYGPFSANIHINKLDTQTGYLFKGLFKNEPYISKDGQVYNNKFLSLEMDMPNSSGRKRLALGLTLHFSKNIIKFEFDSPWTRKVTLMSTLKLSDEEKRGLFLFTVGNEKVVKLRIQHNSHVTKSIRTEKGVATVEIRTLQAYETNWKFVGKRDKWTVDIESKGFFKEKNQMKLKVEEVKSVRQLSLADKYKLSGSYETFFGSGKLSGVASDDYYGHRWDVKLNHNSRANPKEKYVIMFRHKTEDKSSKSLLKYFLTSTISYGERAENSVKFELENELSARHIRASIRTNFDETKQGGGKTSTEMNLQLYGGYTWKEDNRLYAEGSLSFKLPSKGVNYEGRYNSEVGKGLFKMVIVLDKDQHSKVNFKINYQQPKLYLKDTECDVTFSLPNHNIKLDWTLKEVDVNKYEYALKGKYNNYLMQIEGKQTEISKLKHDSSLTITMPKIHFWPEKVNVNLRVDFVDLKKSLLSGKFEIPNTDHKYSVDLKSSYIPQNFLQLPMSESNSVFKYQLEVGNAVRKIKSESTFTCNPEEVQVYFNLAWNADKYKDEKVTFDFQTTNKSPNYKQFDHSARITVHYPGNSHSLGFKSQFKYTELVAQIDMTWNRNQKISLVTAYEVDNSWTQKGAKASITLKTPFPGLELTHLNINAIGQLRYRKVDIEFKWAGNRKILFDIVVQPRSSNDFTMTTKLVTPFKGMTLISLETKHLSTANSILSSVGLEFGPTNRYNIKFEGISNSEGKNRDFASNLVIESGIFSPLKVSFSHKDDTIHFDSQFDVMWQKTESINIKSKFSYSFGVNELITNGNVELLSTIEEIKQMKAAWSMENTESTFINNVQILYRSKNIFQNSIKGFVEKEETSYKMDFNGFIRIMSNQPLKVTNLLRIDIPMTIVTNLLRIDEPITIVNSFSLMNDDTQSYSHSINIKGPEITIKMFVLNSEFKTAEFKSSYEKKGQTESSESLLKIGERFLFKKSAKFRASQDSEGRDVQDVEHDIYSDYIQQKFITLKTKVVKSETYKMLECEVTSRSSLLFKYKLDISVEPSKKMIAFSIKSGFRQFKFAEFSLKTISKEGAPNVAKFMLNYNDELKAKFDIKVMNLQLIDIDIFFKYKYLTKYLRFKHNQQLMGYEHLLDTNLFGVNLKIASSTESRGGTAIHSSLKCNHPLLKSLDVVGRFSKKESKLDIIYQYAKTYESNDMVKLTYSKKGLHYLFNIDSSSLISTSIKLDLIEFKTLDIEFRTLDMSILPKIDIKLNYAGGMNAVKHSSEIRFGLGSVNLLLKNKIEERNGMNLLVESKIKANGFDLDYKLGRGDIYMKAVYNKKFVLLTATLPTSSNFVMAFKIETTFEVLREMILEMKHDQSRDLSKVLHSCKISVKSNDMKFKMDNKVQWNRLDYIKVESSIVARTSKENYVIQPKSLKFIHQFDNSVKETFEIFISEDIQLKVNLEVPVAMKSSSFLNIESPFTVVRKLRIDVALDLTDSAKQTLNINVERNENRVLSVEHWIARMEGKMSISMKVEVVKLHSIELVYERTVSTVEQLEVITRSSLLKEDIKLKISYDKSSKEGLISISGKGENTFYLLGKTSRTSMILTVKHLALLGQFELTLDEKMFKLETELRVGPVMKLNVQVFPRSSELILVVNENVIKMSGILSEQINIDINVLKTAVTLKIKSLSTNPYKYEVSGTTNFNNWSSFFGEIYFLNGALNQELTSKFRKEESDVYNLIVRNTKTSFNVKWETIFDVVKSGELNVLNEVNTKVLLIKFNAQTFNKNTINANFNLNEAVIEGRISSSFEWMENAEVRGELKRDKDQIEGSFRVTHNKWTEALKGKISYRIDLMSWEIKINTPLASPLNEIKLTKKREYKKVTLELRDEGSRIFMGVLDLDNDSKSRLYLDVNIPEKYSDFKMTLDSLVNTQDVPYFVHTTLKTNFFQEINFKATCDTVKKRYGVSFNHPSNEGSMKLEIAKSSLSLTSDFNSKKTAVDITYKVKGATNFNGKINVVSNMYDSHPLNFNMVYEHNIDLPKELSLVLQSEWNGQIVFLSGLNWRRDDASSFELKSKLVVRPYNKEYKSSFELSLKKGREFNLIISPLGDSKESDINVKFNNQVGEKRLNINTPYDMFRTIEFLIKDDKSSDNWKQMIMFNSNYLGKIELTNEILMPTDGSYITTSHLKSPYKYGNIKISIRQLYEQRDLTIGISVDVDEVSSKIMLKIAPQQWEVKIDSTLPLIKNIELLIKQDANTYKMVAKYNDNKVNIDVIYSQQKFAIAVESSGPYSKDLSFTFAQDTMRSVNLKLNKDGQTLKIKGNFQDNIWKFDLENSLLVFVPKSLQGTFKYIRPLNLMIELNKDSRSIFKVIIKRNEFFFNAKTTLSEVKIAVTSSKLEVVVFSSKAFSILIDRKITDQIDVTLTINDAQYQSSVIYRNDAKKLRFSTKIYKNSLEKLFEVYVDMSKVEREFDFELNMLTKPILKLKLSDNRARSRKIMTEIRYLFLYAIFDIDSSYENDLVVYKFFWNVKMDESQLSHGSILYSLKMSFPRQFLLDLNFATSAYQFQLSEVQSGRYLLKTSTPYKELDLELLLALYYNRETREFKHTLKLKNEMIGEYNVDLSGKLTRDFEIKFRFDTFRSIIAVTFKVPTLIPDEYSMSLRVDWLTWKKIELLTKLEMGDKVKLVISLVTPFRILKRIHVEKTLWFSAPLEHRFETIMEYKGIISTKYVGNHKISLLKGIITFNGGLQHEEIKVFSMKMEGRKNSDGFNHVLLFDIREKQYGYKVEAKSNPLLEGKTEIFMPFHDAGVLVLQGRQMKDGIKIQVGKDREEITSFEYTSTDDVKFMRVTPPLIFGKPMAVKYQHRRYRRSVGEGFQADVKYGDEKLLTFNSKVNLEKEKNAVVFKITSPIFSKQSAELKLMHKYEPNGYRFNHHIKIKDSDEKLYKIIGDIYHKDQRDFKYEFMVHHPYSGPLHIQLGHILGKNNYNSHLSIKNNNKVIILHNGKMMFQLKKVGGEWEIQTPNRHIRVMASHSGDIDDFKQRFSSFYNKEPLIMYKADISREKKSVIKFDIPISNGLKVDLTFDRQNKKAGATVTTTSSEFDLEIVEKEGEFNAIVKFNKERFASFDLGFATTPLFVHATFKKHSIKLEATLKDSVILVKSETTFRVLKTATLRVTKNKLMVDADCNGELLSLSLEYHFVPNNFFLVMETSSKQLSKMAIYVSPSEIKININEYFQILRFIFNWNHLMLVGENNFYAVKTFKLNANLDKTKEAASCKLEINSFVSDFDLKIDNDKILFDVSNNRFFPRTLQLELSRKSEKTQHLWIARLTVEKRETIKLIGQLAENKYSIGLETNFQTSLVFSFDRKKNELIVSFVRGERYINLIGRVQKMTSKVSSTFVTDVSVDSSSQYLEKMATQVSYTATKTEVFLSFIGRYNKKRMVTKWEFTKTHALFSLDLNNDVYSGRITMTSSKELVSMFTTPTKKLIVEMKNEGNTYTLNVKYNEEEVFKAIVKQDTDVSKQLKHSSEVWYRGNNFWAFDLSTNFQSYDIKMRKPLELEINLTNEWKSKKGRTVSFWTKYLIYGETYEKGFGVTLNLGPASEFFEVYIENSVHVIKLSRWDHTVFDMQLSMSLLNKVTKKQWIIETENHKNEKYEIYTTFPEGKRSIKFHQLFKNNVRVLFNLEVFDKIKLSLKSDDKSMSLIGSLSLFEKEIANIEAKGDNVKVVINKDGSESKRISIEWTKTISGKWREDYIASRRLIVKQKALKIDVDFEHELKVEKSLLGMTTKCKYGWIDGRVEKLLISATADFSIPDVLTVELKNPVIPLKSVFKRRQPNKSSLRYEMETIMNENYKISGYLEISVGQNLGYTSKLYYNPNDRNDFLQIHAKYIDDRQVEVRIFDESKKSTTNYFQILIRLLNENKIETTFKLRTDSFELLRYKIRSVTTVLKYRIEKFAGTAIELITQEWYLRYKQMMEIIPASKEITEQLNILMRKVNMEVDSLNNEILMIIKDNEFYFDEITRQCVRVVYFVSYGVYNTCSYICMKVTQFDWRFLIEMTKRVFNEISRQTWFILRDILSPFERAFIRTFENYFPMLFKNIIINAEHVLNFIRDTAISLRSRMYELRRLRKIIVLEHAYVLTARVTEMLKNVFGSITTGSLNFLNDENEFKTWYVLVITKLLDISREIVENIDQVVSRADETAYMLTGEKYCSKLKKILSEVFEYLLSQLKDEGNQKMIKGLLVSSIDNSFGIINQKIYSFTNTLIVPRYFVVKQYDLIDINYDFQVISPIPLNDIKSIPDFSYVSKKVEEVKGIVGLIQKMLRERVLSGQRLLELLRWFTPQLPFGSLSYFVPDFESYATILGSSVVTFDKKSLELKPDICQVTLVKDMRFKKWEVVLEQNKNGRTYTVSIGKDKVSISMKDNKIYLNQKATELPFSIGSSKIMAFGSVVQVKDDIIGLKITVDPINDMLTVGISGWYHGKVRGLFGNADNEPFNDMMDESGKILASKDFFNIYSNGGNVCRMSKDMSVESEDNKSCPFLRKLVCKFLYKCPLSPMAACFGKVDPKRFLSSCTDGSHELSMKLDKSVCTSARSYQVQCAAAGVKIPVPFPCRKCDIEGEGPIPINDYRNEKTKEKVADIVIVVDEGKCLKNIHAQVNSIITQIDANMKDRGISEVRYGVVAFRGDAVIEAHTHTVNHKLFGSRDELLSSLKSLKSTDQDVKDIVGAITLASTYPFRRYASKHIVLINCGQCEESLSRFNTLNELLEKQAIRFSALMDYDFQVKESKEKKMIYGIDSKSMYTRLSKRGEIATDIIRPTSDCCYKLAMKTYGVVFNINYLIVKNEATQKSFIDTFATQVTVSAIPARTTRCRCDDDGEYNCVPLDTYAIFPTKKT